MSDLPPQVTERALDTWHGRLEDCVDTDCPMYTQDEYLLWRAPHKLDDHFHTCGTAPYLFTGDCPACTEKEHSA